jgi:hypothetical protein
MFVEGTLRWQVTEDCPWDLLMALALRELARLEGAAAPAIPRLSPTVVPILHGATGVLPVPTGAAPATDATDSRALLERQWSAFFELTVDRERRPILSLLKPPHFEALDRAIELQDLVMAHYDEAVAWTRARHAEYARTSIEQHARRAAAIVDVVHEREYALRRQAGYFRLDLYVLPLAERGAWIVGPHTVILSTSLRDDPDAFREWFTPVVAALV